MKQYKVTGMSCATCSARVEKAVSSVEGVTECSVNLLTNSMNVNGTARDDEIIRAVIRAGYGVEIPQTEGRRSPDVGDEKDEIRKMKTRLFSSLIFLIVLMYVSMGHTMWSFPLPSVVTENPVTLGLIQLLLTTVVLVINQKFFTNGFKGLIKGAPNMDSLVALGSGAAFAYSTLMIFVISQGVFEGDLESAKHHLHNLYFESSAMIVTLITVGKLLETYSKGKTTDAIRDLMKLAPETAVVLREGKEVAVSVEEIRTGDVVVVRSGEGLPADGVVVEGSASVDESALTGESIPADKSVGDNVTGGTVNKAGFIKYRVTAVAEDTVLSKIIKTVRDTAASKAPISKAADKVSGIFVPAVIAVALVTVAVWLTLGKDVGFALARGISVLVISCPCALGLATPVAIMVGSGVGAKHGILFKTAAALEESGRVKIVALDKTGTITKGEPQVTDVVAVGMTQKELLELAYSLEVKSEHPLAKAIVKKAEEQSVDLSETECFEVLPGNGITAKLNGIKAVAGNLKFISSFVQVDSEELEKVEKLARQGKTPLCFCVGDTFAGIIAVADSLKEDSRDAVEKLKDMGLQVIMITGDNEKTAKTIGDASGIENIVADVLPLEKNQEIQRLAKCGRVAMVGDGINDAPALVTADCGIALGAGADIAIDAADVVVMKNSLMDVADAIKLGRSTLRNIYENLFWAFIYNVIGIPVAAGVLMPFGVVLTPMLGAAAMSLSSFCVVSNALRLNFVKLGKTEKIKEVKVMTKTLKIEGMMCPHCEANVKTTLEGLGGVVSAEVSHKAGTAVVTLNESVADEVLKQAVEGKGYTVISVE